jgi:hypothetical protein
MASDVDPLIGGYSRFVYLVDYGCGHDRPALEIRHSVKDDVCSKNLAVPEIVCKRRQQSRDGVFQVSTYSISNACVTQAASSTQCIKPSSGGISLMH